MNLAINARDAMRNGGRLVIECRNARLSRDSRGSEEDLPAGDYVQISVTDSGSGMAADVRARAFEPFFTTKGLGQGSGLGLSMVYGFAKQSGGHAEIKSEVGRGTTVRLYLPRAVNSSRPEEAHPSGALPRGLGESILIVEDDEDLRSMACVMLDELGYQVRGAADAGQARSLISTAGPFDLMLTDIVLPGGTSGLQIAMEVRSRLPEIKVVFMSGYSTGGQGRMASRDILLDKPFKRQQLAEAVRHALSVRY